MRSRSILLKERSDLMCWYYQFLKYGRHFVEVDERDSL